MKRAIPKLIAVMSVGLLVLAACSSDDTGDDASGGQASGDEAWLVEAQESAASSTEWPTTINAAELGDVEPAEDMSLYFIGCDQSIPGCVAQVEGFEQAGEALGYDVEVCDAKFDVAAFQNCMSIAVEASPDAIVNNARPQSDAPEAYEAAHAAGIPVIGQFTSEKPDPETGNAAEVGYVCESEGEMLGDYIVAESEGTAQVAMFADTVYRCNQQRADGVKKALDKCPTCSIDVQQFSVGTAQTDLPPMIQATLQSDQNLNWVVGSPGLAGTMAADAIRQASREGQISVGTFDGDEPEMALVRQGDIIKANVVSGVYENGWTVMDVILRLSAGQSIPDNIENPTTILFTEENAPEEGTYEGAEDFREQFKQLWGVT